MKAFADDKFISKGYFSLYTIQNIEVEKICMALSVSEIMLNCKDTIYQINLSFTNSGRFSKDCGTRKKMLANSTFSFINKVHYPLKDKSYYSRYIYLFTTHSKTNLIIRDLSIYSIPTQRQILLFKIYLFIHYPLKDKSYYSRYIYLFTTHSKTNLIIRDLSIYSLPTQRQISLFEIYLFIHYPLKD